MRLLSLALCSHQRAEQTGGEIFSHDSHLSFHSSFFGVLLIRGRKEMSYVVMLTRLEK